MSKISHSNCDHEGHDHSHSGHAHHHHGELKINQLFKIGICLNLIFVVIEAGFGHKIGSLALISDALHNLTDVIGLIVAWIGFALSSRSKSKKYSYITALINAVLIILGSLWVIYEAFERFKNPQLPEAGVIISVALVGCAINFASAKLFHSHQHDLNMKAAYIHLIGDALISLGVVLSGILIYFSQALWIDAVTSLIISLVVIIVTVPILRESVQALRSSKI